MPEPVDRQSPEMTIAQFHELRTRLRATGSRIAELEDERDRLLNELLPAAVALDVSWRALGRDAHLTGPAIKARAERLRAQRSPGA